MSLVTLVVVLVPAVVVGCYPLWITRLFARNRRPRPSVRRRDQPPSLSVIVPCRGLEEHSESNINSLLRQTFQASTEILFCVESPADPVVALLERLLRDRPTVPVQLVMTGEAGEHLGKMHNLLGGLSRAVGQRLVFLDSDVLLPDSDFLNRFLTGLDQPGVGLVSCFPAYRDFHSTPAAAIGLMINNDLLGMFATLGMLGPLSVANGSCLAIDRDLLDEAGGLSALRDQLLMDTALARRVLQAGYRVWLHEEAAPVRSGDMSWRQVWQQAQRWQLAMWRVLPRAVYCGFAWIRSGLLLGAMATVATGLDPAVGAAVAISLAVRLLTSAWLDQRHLHSGSFFRYVWLLPLIELMNGWGALTSPLSREATWRGRSYLIDRRGRATRKVSSDPAPR
jgi:ceramide glucosyltransferase